MDIFSWNPRKTSDWPRASGIGKSLPCIFIRPVKPSPLKIKKELKQPYFGQKNFITVKFTTYINARQIK
jgi:hypothetical protein